MSAENPEIRKHTVIDLGIVRQAYCFFHQKYRIYASSSSERERDDIEYAVNSYLQRMSPALYGFISDGREGFLREHSTFAGDMDEALSRMEELL